MLTYVTKIEQINLHKNMAYSNLGDTSLPDKKVISPKFTIFSFIRNLQFFSKD